MAHTPKMYNHSLLVAEITETFAATLGLAHTDKYTLVKAALLHDFGKIGISKDLLMKQDRLTHGEMTEMRSHTRMGYRILADQGTFSADVLDVALHHHERLDGSGYPDGLKGPAIRDVVRIVTLCDIYAALTEPRTYRPGLTSSDALQVMIEMGAALDADLFTIFREFAANWLYVCNRKGEG